MFWNHLVTVVCILSCTAFVYELTEFCSFMSHVFDTRTTMVNELSPKNRLRIGIGNSTRGVPSFVSLFLSESSTKAPSNAYIREMKTMEELRQSYLEQMKKKQQTPVEDNPESTKYVIFHPLKAGLGNSLAAIMDALLVSMFIDRKFYRTFCCAPSFPVYEYPIFDSYYTLPFKYHTYSSNGGILGFSSYSDFLQSDSLIVDKACTLLANSFFASTKKFIIFRSGCRIFDFVVYGEQFRPFLHAHGFARNRTRYDPEETKKTLKRFMYNHVVAVKPFVIDEVNRVKKELSWDDYYVIGLQIRTGRLFRDDAYKFFIQDSDILYFEAVAKRVTKEVEATLGKPVRWFLACDNMEQRKAIQARNPGRVIMTHCPIVHSFIDMWSSHETESMLCTLVDNYLLSSTQYIIITIRSSYGLLALSRNPDIPKTLVRYGEQNDSP